MSEVEIIMGLNHSGKTLEKREKVTETRHSNKMGITAASFGIIFLFLISSASFLISKYENSIRDFISDWFSGWKQ